MKFTKRVTQIIWLIAWSIVASLITGMTGNLIVVFHYPHFYDISIIPLLFVVFLLFVIPMASWLEWIYDLD